MSYIAYINNERVDLKSAKDIALTKQVNDIARLDTRQSNFAHKFTLPLTANNIRVMRNCYVIGNQSNVPYQKNRFDLIDAESGKHLVYNGWATISLSSDKGYDVNTYDGIVDFYKTIELLTLTDVGIADLNHTKTIANIVDSWDDSKEYKYILADYNGKKYTALNNLNADYLVPSARITYLWDRVHAFAGMSYTGTTFLTEAFSNLYATFPKPLPTDSPTLTLISEQDLGFTINQGPILVFYPICFPALFDTAQANNLPNPNSSRITFEIDGAFRLRASGTLYFPSGASTGAVKWTHYSSSFSIISQGSINGTIGGFVDILVSAGDILVVEIGSFFDFWVGNIRTSLYYITGYSVNFADALVDFKAKDFVNNIMQLFGLTAYKDPYSNTIEYLTLDEILQNTEVLDWSDKFISKTNEAYILSGYAQKNNFRYRYNSDNQEFNDGSIYINNENIKDETTIVTTKFYSPEFSTAPFLGTEINVFKFWDKEIKDDGGIDYKSLSGRYYLLRSEDYPWGTPNTIESEALGTSATFATAPIANYFRLKMQQIIYDNYAPIGSILDKSKIVLANLWLTPSDYENFDFKRLVYIKTLGSYFLVNKITNFIKGTPTKCELIEVDYFTELDVTEPIDYTIAVDNLAGIDYTACEATFTIATDVPIPSNIEIIPYALTPDGSGGTFYAPVTLATPIIVSLTGSALSYIFDQLPPVAGGYKFKFRYNLDSFYFIESNFSNVLGIDGACYVPQDPNLSYITITDVETLSIVGNLRNVRITYESDLSTSVMGITAIANSVTDVLPPYSEGFFLQPQNGYVDILIGNYSISGGVAFYNLQLQALGVTSNTATS
jgi:hypothetical protein